MPVRKSDGLRAAVDPQLREDALDVRRDRLRTDDEPLSDAFLAEALREKLQDVVLAFGQVDISTTVPRFDRPPHLRDQLVTVERLRDVVVRSEQQTRFTVVVLSPVSGNEEDRHLARELSTQETTDLIAGDVRELDLEQHQRGAIRPGGLNCLTTVRCSLRLEPCGSQ